MINRLASLMAFAILLIMSAFSQGQCFNGKCFTPVRSTIAGIADFTLGPQVIADPTLMDVAPAPLPMEEYPAALHQAPVVVSSVVMAPTSERRVIYYLSGSAPIRSKALGLFRRSHCRR